MKLQIDQVGGGQRNVTFRISGTVESDRNWIRIPTGHKSLKLTSVLWLIEEKMGLYLGWNKEQIQMPLESRNSLRLDQGIPSPTGWDGDIWLFPYRVTEGEMAFFLVLDFDK